MKIFYFTGSGNSLAIAKKLAADLDADLISIASLIDSNSIRVNDDCFGIVFPIYFASNYNGIPLIVQRFIKKLTSLNDKYIFAVATSGYSPGSALENLYKLLKELKGQLNSSFVINTSIRNLKDDISLKIKNMFNLNRNCKPEVAISKNQDDTINIIKNIFETVNNRHSLTIKTKSKLSKYLKAPFTLLIKFAFTARYKKLAGEEKKQFEDYINFADNAFEVNENCIGCGICTKICPVNNITLEGNKPKWHNKCENCLACYQWCKQNAIGGEMVKYNERYHHEDISLEDMLTHTI